MPIPIPIPNVAIAALAHHYESRSIDASVGDGDNISLGTKKSQTVSSNESFIGNAREALRANEAASAASECDGEESVSAVAIKRTHLKEALASHEEAQRLQRMCRYLKVSQLHQNICGKSHLILFTSLSSFIQNKTSLTQVIKEAHYKTQDEYERFSLQSPVKNIDECYDLFERTVEGS